MRPYVKVRGRMVYPVSYDEANRVANIFGPSSAAWRALDEFERRRATGEEVGIFRDRAMLIVGPVRALNPPEGEGA